MFTEDGAFEMPYLESLGITWRYKGRKQVEDFSVIYTQIWTFKTSGLFARHQPSL
jgi:hypothetical protein